MAKREPLQTEDPTEDKTAETTPTPISDVRAQLLKSAEGLIHFRFNLSRLLVRLDSGGEKETEGSLLRADLECALVDHFDPLLKILLEAAGGSRWTLLETAFELAAIRHRLQCFREALPRSPDEDDMLDGKIPTDVPTEMKATVGAVIEDQLSLAYENLLYAAWYSGPEPAGPAGAVRA